MRFLPALFLPLLFVILSSACAPTPTPTIDQGSIERGRYLVRISGCNDCHTEGFMENNGAVPEAEWLTGSRRGWFNEQGTSYAANLRLLISTIDEQQWITLARTMRTRSPMAWYRLREISDADLSAIYRYLRWLGPAGTPVPAALPPGVTPAGPYIYFPAAH